MVTPTELWSSHEAHMGTETAHMAYPACEAVGMAHVGTKATHMANRVLKWSRKSTWKREGRTRRDQLAKLSKWPTWGTKSDAHGVLSL